MQRMFSLSIGVLFFASSVLAQGGGGRQGGAPAGPVGLAAGQQQSYNRVKGLVMGSANEMPEDGFSHKPADGIRTFAQLFAHISDFHYGTCAQALGVPNPRMGQPSLEMSVATKADALKTLQESYAFCDPAFSSLTDQSIAELIMGGRGGPRARGAILSQLLEHDNEMYGISTVYLRTNSRVPPASQGRGRGGAGGRQGGRGQ
jgi:hypothetical protein